MKFIAICVSILIILVMINSFAGGDPVKAFIDGKIVECETNYMEPDVYICAPLDTYMFNLGGNNK